MKNFPRQRLSSKEKAKDNFRWARECMDALLEDAVTYDKGTGDYERKRDNYNLFNNIIDQSKFERDCNRLGIDVGQFKDEIKPYNKTYNKLQVLLGEELKRPFPFKVININPEGIKSKLAYRDEVLRNTILSKIENTLAAFNLQFQSQIDPSKVVDETELQKIQNLNFLDAKEITGAKLLKFLLQKENIKDKRNDAFKHGLISGEELIYVGVKNNEPYMQPLNSLSTFFHKSPEQKFVQYSLYAGQRTYMTSAEVLDTYLNLSKEEQRQVDERIAGPYYTQRDNTINSEMKYFHDDYYTDRYVKSDYEGSYGSANEGINTVEYHLVQHVEWVSQKKVGFIEYVDMFGDAQTDIVDENFEIPFDAVKKKDKNKNTTYTWNIQDANGITTTYTFTETWIPEVWEGTKIGDNIYTNVGPKEYQFRSLDNPYKVKLGYHGIVYNAMNAPSQSMMDRMRPFQELYFIVAHKMKKLIAQDKGPIFNFDTSMVDPKIGVEKTLYYLTELNINFYNPLQNAEQPGWSQRPGKPSDSSSMSTTQYIANYIQILDALDQQISDVAGVNRQREGQVTPNEAVANTQSNITMSAMITEVYFQAHNKVWEEVLNTLLEVANTCYKHKSKTIQFIMDDLALETINLTPDSLLNADFGVFVVDSMSENRLFAKLEFLTERFVANGQTKVSDIIKMFRTDSSLELEEYMRIAEQRQIQEQMEMQNQQIEAQKQMQAAEQEFQLEKQKRDLKAKILIAEINSFSRQDQDINDNNIPDQLEIEQVRAGIRQKDRELDIKEKELAIKRTKKST